MFSPVNHPLSVEVRNMRRVALPSSRSMNRPWGDQVNTHCRAGQLRLIFDALGNRDWLHEKARQFVCAAFSFQSGEIRRTGGNGSEGGQGKWAGSRVLCCSNGDTGRDRNAVL